jgi:hypothetical protein
MSARLPRSLDPLPDESLPGYLLRLAHRLDLSPARLGQITGLTKPPRGVRASSMLALSPDDAAAFAHATRLTTTEVAALTLNSLSPRYPPVDPVLAGRQRRVVRGLFVKENWIFSRFTRYCPQCLAGNGSIIQQRHGGVWNKLWRLPVVFACPNHHRLLEYACPACEQPALARGSGAAMLPRDGDSTLHPTACRTNLPTRPHQRPPACGHRLDQTRLATHHGDLTALLALQDRLLNLLHPDGKRVTASVGVPATAAQYFIDLRILTCLITASWPAADRLVPSHQHAARIDAHVRHIRQQIAEDRDSLRLPRDNARHDKPPPDAATAAALLTAAETITNAGDPDTVRGVLAPLLEAEPGSRTWIRQFMPGDGYCSPGLQTAIGPEVGAMHVIKRTGVPHHAIRRRLPPPRPMRYGVQHIPQRPPSEWTNTYFADFTDLKPRLLEHVVAIRLAHTGLGGTTGDAAIRLGIPRRAADNAIRVVNRALTQTARHAAFDQAIRDLTEHLNTLTGLTDYGGRRDALGTWEITPDQWRTLIQGLPEQPVMGKPVPHTHWGNGKRTLATVWVWTRLTHGHHIYAPAVRPDPQAPRPGGDQVHYVHTRWRFINKAIPGHYAALRQRLDSLARDLTEKIDGTRAQKRP